MNITIKKFDELLLNELYDIIKLRLNVFVVEQNCVYNDLDGNDLNAHHVICTNDNGMIIAVLRIAAKNTRFENISIGRIVVDERYRKQGIGQEIIEFAINYIKQNALDTEIYISAQAHLQRFYSQFGFKSCSNIYLEDNIEHIKMRLDLQS